MCKRAEIVDNSVKICYSFIRRFPGLKNKETAMKKSTIIIIILVIALLLIPFFYGMGLVLASDGSQSLMTTVL